MQDPILRTINQYNQRPQKQGGLYSLNLGQNNGPYLPKDVMIINKNEQPVIFNKNEESQKQSLSLLAKAGNMQIRSNQLMEPNEIYDDIQKQFTNYDERYQSKLSASDNLKSGSNYQENELIQYKQQIEQLEKELKIMNEQINNDNITNIRELQPILKEFNLRLKEQLSNEKNESYKLLREIEYLNREKLQIQQSVLFSHKRIVELENLVGIQKVQKLEQTQEDQAIEEEYEDDNQEELSDDQYQKNSISNQSDDFN